MILHALLLIATVSVASVQATQTYITGIWDNTLSVIHDDGSRMGVHSLSLSSEAHVPRAQWEFEHMIRPSYFGSAMQLPNTSLLLIMHSSLTVYDLSVHEFIDNHNVNTYNAHDQLQHHGITCVTLNPLDRILYIIQNDGSLSFHLFTNTWRRDRHTPFQNNMPLQRVNISSNADCSVEGTYSHIYIFGGTSQTKHIQTVLKYTIISNEWSTVKDVVINQQMNHARLRCALLPSDGNIRCIAGNILYTFNPSYESLIKDYVASYNMRFSALAVWLDSCMLIVGGNSTDNAVHIQYIGDCAGNDSISQTASSPPSSSIATNESRRRLASWPTVTLNSSYTENVTLQAGPS
eukprot:843886_1